MKQNGFHTLAAPALSLSLAACVVPPTTSAPEVVAVSSNHYMIAQRDPGGLIGNTAALKARIIKEARAFAESKGKHAVPVPFDEIPGWPNPDPLLIEYHFRLSDSGESAAPPAAHSSGVDQLAADLMKLDELRRKGLLTDEEFLQQKRKLIED